jgi:hypothetical protein
MIPEKSLSNEQLIANLRKISDMASELDSLLQETFEADDELYNLHNFLDTIAMDYGMEADELESIDG